MNQKIIDRRREDSLTAFQQARALANAGEIEKALARAFYAGKREADAEYGEEELDQQRFGKSDLKESVK